ncbi:MAG: YbaN family protein [Candidatus Krumholzibacteria bacterium]|nr:YbaN family protein [Candidatus Krumholzibacteria bacterium]
MDDTPRSSPSPSTPRPQGVNTSGHVRVLLLMLGWVFVGLAVIGAVLPVVPTTPFLLVAAACFARSSPRFYKWILHSPVFGPTVRSWQETRTIPRRVKFSAVLLLGIVGVSSALFFLGNLWARIVFFALLVAVMVWILRIPSTREVASSVRPPDRAFKN